MRKYVLFYMLLACCFNISIAQVKIGAAGNPHVNAVLDLDGGSSRGLLLPRLTDTEMTALSTAPDGLLIYNRTDQSIYIRKSAAWRKISDAGGGGGLTLPYAGIASTLGGAEFSITHTTTFGDAVAFSNTAGGAALTTISGNNKLNMTGGNTGIGIPAGLTENPSLAKLVVRGTVGAVAAMFGDNTAGVSIMNNLPSIGFNYYYNSGGKSISTGYGAALGQDQSTGRIYFSNSTASVTGAGTLMPLTERITILPNGNIGFGITAPASPLSFPAVLSKKISLYPGATGDVGLSVQPNELRMYSDNSNAVITMGYDNFSTGFKESFRINPWGSTVATNPVNLAANTENALYFKTANFYTGALKAIGVDNSHVRIGIYGYAANTAGELREYLSISDAGFVGIGNTDPKRPLSFPAVLEKKISLYPGATGDAGFGVFANELRINSDNSNADITLGYDNFTNGFTERMRVKGNGNVGIGTNNPASRLDMVGRMRIRGTLNDGVNTAGIYFDGVATAQRSFIGTFNENTLGFYGANVGWNFFMDVNDGAIMIGTNQKATGYKVNVAGKIIAEEVRVQLRSAWPDYVFEKEYKKLNLYELKHYLAVNKHLPNIPSAADVEKDGQQLGEVQRKMLEKMEELTLYILELKQEIDNLKNK